MKLEQNTYDQYADRYVDLLAQGENQEFSLYHNFIVPSLLLYAGGVKGKRILDAGCGEGYLSRLLCEKGASVVGIDISPKLIGYARERVEGRDIDYRICDLSKQFPGDLEQSFDLIVSNLVIDDVPDHRGFIHNLGILTRADARVVLTMNNPYSAVIRGKVENYFDSETAVLYQGLSSTGVKVYYFHRTLEEYVSAFAQAGFRLKRLSDMKPKHSDETSELGLDPERCGKYYHFPFFMMLEFIKAQ